jgi:hypothetical protein
MPDSRNTDEPTTASGQPGAPQEARCVQLFLERFPHIRQMSQELLKDSESFRELCEEYEACTSVIQRLAHSEADAALLSEYSALRLRLEGELLRCISSYWSAKGPA